MKDKLVLFALTEEFFRSNFWNISEDNLKEFDICCMNYAFLHFLYQKRKFDFLLSFDKRFCRYFETEFFDNSNLRKVDFICRYGGEEFLIILPATNADEAMIVAEKIQSKINSTSVLWQQKEMTFTLSIGCATCKTHINVDQLLQLADEAMYLAKNTGRNTICTKELNMST